ncbi:MAG: hypothetical protein KatS3mg095_0700 [Candidatus Parcubacteria bacterium]|nr:MAG: hypothetical protein KatS3mg095_0700 [Candidatus Parcubacteria bacterium]
MKKITLVLLILILVASFTLAQNTINNITPNLNTKYKSNDSKKIDSIKNNKINKLKLYNACIGQKVRNLTKEMQNKRKDVLSNYRNELKLSTSTNNLENLKELRKKYINTIKEINKWYNNELRKIKQECIKTNTKASNNTTNNISEVIIKITNNGFEPKEVKINKGTKVTWINESSNPSWLASAVHPTHRVYPGSGIEKCGTPEQEKIFDACRGLNKGETWSFVFNEVGEWYYHDHLNPSLRGEIVVK